MRKWLRWQHGRQGTGYRKMLLFRSRVLRMDLWLLSSGTDVDIPSHVDPAPVGYRHVRLNMILRSARRGGVFTGDKVYVDRPRLKIFRSDRPHAVTRVEDGTRLVLSAGILRKER